MAKEVEQPILIDGRRPDDVRVYSEPVQTLEARMGTGGNNVPLVALSDMRESDQQSPHAVTIPIHDTATRYKGKRGGDDPRTDGKGNGLGVGQDSDPMYTLTSADHHAVAIGIQGNMIGRQDHNGPAGKGYTDEGDPMFTLNATDIHAVSYDGYNQKLDESDIHRSLRVGRDSSDFIAQSDSEMCVRRLTPEECELLMGWPIFHTKFNADGTIQADTHRYKQCGNGVASPVAKWIGGHIVKLVDMTKEAE